MLPASATLKIDVATSPTPYPELNEVLSELRQGLEEALRANLVGLYLQGSFALGGFDEHSDVDFIAVTERELAREEADAVAAVHKIIFGLPSEWAKHLEGSYFSREQLLGPAPKDIYGEEGKVWYLDHGSATLERSTHCNTLVVRWTLYHHGIALCGPEVRSLLNPIDPNALRHESRQTLLDWGRQILDKPSEYANRFYQGLIVLTCCRVLHTVQTGAVHSKRASAKWAKEDLPGVWHGLIERVWATRPDPATSVRTAADPEDFNLTLALVRFSMDKLSPLPPSPHRPTL